MCRCKCVWLVFEWNVFEDVVCSRNFNLYSSQASGRPLHACVWGGWYFVCSMPNYLRAQMVHSKPTKCKGSYQGSFSY